MTIQFSDMPESRITFIVEVPNVRFNIILCLFVFGATAPQGAMPSSFTRFLYHTQWRTTVGRTPTGEWSARRRDLYLYNTQHSRQTNIHAPGGIQIHDFSKRAAADPRLRPRGHWDRNIILCTVYVVPQTLSLNSNYCVKSRPSVTCLL
jgi:hypothetical protein